MKFSSFALLFAALLMGCNDRDAREAADMTHGDPARGKVAIQYYGCSSCHTIPGIAAANAWVGPPLMKMGSRSYIAGVIKNNPDNLVRWIQDPPAIDDKTAMPNLHVSEKDARDIAGYLYAIR